MTDKNNLPCASCRDLTQCHLLLPVSKLNEGVDNNCKACSLMRDVISRFVPFSDIETIRISVDCALYIYAYLKGTQGQWHVTIEVSAKPGKPSRWKNIGPAKVVLPMANENGATVELIKHWLDDCRARHPSCQVPSTAILPARVIDVGVSPETVSLHVSERGEKGSYVSLSHCWGGHTPLATTKATLAEHQKSLRFDDSSKTFAQAVELTRALGFKYLWIDSLCIVQDDPNDWEIEAAKMNQVYSNAALTLSADSAEDTSQGLFGRPAARVSANNTFAITTEDPAGLPVQIYARLRSSRPSDPDSAPHSSFPTKPSKLSTRAWVLQERILSPRMVHFYQEELVWSCFGQKRCECRPLAAASPSSGTFRRILTSASSTITSARPPNLNTPFPAEHNLLIEWPKIVSQFTRKGLTYPKDRLPALSGLATLMQTKLPPSTRYLAGLWSSDMAYSLLWISHHDAAAATPPDSQIQPIIITRMPIVPYAPSWSWASVVGPVRYIDRHLDQFANRRSGDDEVKPVYRVLRASTWPQAPARAADVYGPVTAGFVTVRGQVLDVVYDPLSGTWRPVNARGGAGNEVGTEEEYVPPRIAPVVIFDVLGEDPRVNSGVAIAGLFRRFVMLRAATYIWEGTMSSRSTEVVALLLVRVEVDGRREGLEEVYVRRGVVLHAFGSDKVWNGVEVKTIIIA